MNTGTDGTLPFQGHIMVEAAVVPFRGTGSVTAFLTADPRWGMTARLYDLPGDMVDYLYREFVAYRPVTMRFPTGLKGFPYASGKFLVTAFGIAQAVTVESVGEVVGLTQCPHCDGNGGWQDEKGDVEQCQLCQCQGYFPYTRCHLRDGRCQSEGQPDYCETKECQTYVEYLQDPHTADSYEEYHQEMMREANE